MVFAFKRGFTELNPARALGGLDLLAGRKKLSGRSGAIQEVDASTRN
jgi:hypothetical protein